MFPFCASSISVAPTVVMPAFKKLVINGLLQARIEVIQNNIVGILLSPHGSSWLRSHCLLPFLETAIVLFVIKIMFNFLCAWAGGEKKKLLMVPCICAIVGDCDAAFSTFSGMGFINNHNACHWSWGNIYRFPWILCPSCIHLNTSRRRQKCILFHLSGCPLLNTSLTLWNYIMCALYPTVMFSLITTLPMGFELQHYFLTWVMWKWRLSRGVPLILHVKVSLPVTGSFCGSGGAFQMAQVSTRLCLFLDIIG